MSQLRFTEKEVVECLDISDQLLIQARDLISKPKKVYKELIPFHLDAYEMPECCIVCGRKAVFGGFCSIGCQVKHFGE